MNSLKRCFFTFSLIVAISNVSVFAAGKLEINDAWIRSAPPNAMMLAGYATLHNAGDAAITINAVTAEGFADTSLHETVMVGDVSQMRSMGDLVIAPGASVAFAPGGKHIMLMQRIESSNRRPHVAITFSFADGGKQSADFAIRHATPTDETAMPVTHDH